MLLDVAYLCIVNKSITKVNETFTDAKINNNFK